jgi:hypothetical protein
MTTVIDTNHTTTSKLPQLKALGIKTIIRYINPLNTRDEKTVQLAEAKAIAAAGLYLGLVCEGWGGAKPGTTPGETINATTGERDALVCRNYAPGIGAPPGACIYFAVDVDVTNAQIQNAVFPYFQSVRRILADASKPTPVYRVGVYGCGSACSVMRSAGLVDFTWLTNAMGWNGSRNYRDSMQWNLLQHLPATMAGLDVDPDETNPNLPLYGDFVPFGGEVPPGPGYTGVFWIQNKLNEVLKLHPGLVLDGVIGPKTQAAIRLALETGSWP